VSIPYPKDLQFLQRCVDLAHLPGSAISPNPRVGAVLVHKNRIIGEGYHQQYGGAHAEVNCVANVKQEDQMLISQSTLYVSLEPCCIFGRTPPCTNLILENDIPKVVIGQIDQTASVSGKGVDILRAAGVDVVIYPDFQPAAHVAMARQLYAGKERPFILLKFAQSADGFLAPANKANYWITSKMSRRLVHFWRSRTRTIVVGAGTILRDDPQLSTRFYPGPSPLPVIIDLKGKISNTNFKVFQLPRKEKPLLLQPTGSVELSNGDQLFFPAEWLNGLEDWDFRRCKAVNPAAITDETSTEIKAKVFAQKLVSMVLKELHKRKHNHLTVEGGSSILHLFLLANYWDEARVFTGQSTYFGDGLPAPALPESPLKTYQLGNDELAVWLRS